MKILVICGDHARHRFVTNQVANHFNLCGILIQKREPIVNDPPIGLASRDRINFIRHFRERQEAEMRYFDNPRSLSVPRLLVDSHDLNQEKSLRFVSKAKADAALVFGTGLIQSELLSCLPQHTVNLHLGISPRYRGAATLFWPFYFLEPAWAGATFHFLVSEPDAGDIVHQVCPPLHPSDGIHDVGCRTVVTAAEDAISLFEVLNRTGVWKRKKQKNTGKIFLTRDFHAHHLRVIYDLYENRIVDAFLDGELPGRRPNLFQQLGCTG